MINLLSIRKIGAQCRKCRHIMRGKIFEVLFENAIITICVPPCNYLLIHPRLVAAISIVSMARRHKSAARFSDHIY